MQDKFLGMTPPLGWNSWNTFTWNINDQLIRESADAMVESGLDLKADVLKAGHHGSSTSTSDAFLAAVNPDYAVISCGKDNSYGHPHQETMDKLNAADISIFRTDEQGTVVAVSDGSSITWSSAPDTEGVSGSEASPDQQTDEDLTGQTTSYVLNQNTMKFHTPDCSSVAQMKEENRVYFEGTREEIMEMGYTPCGQCEP